MFKKILVANRGEIACRVFKTAKKLGIETVAVHSEADRGTRHVKMADEAIEIGPPPAAESYLDIDKIVEACRQTGADAVHPGYGFLSERREFAERLAKEGITFIGPPPGAIEAMGDKITSKKIASEAGVSTVPGYMGLIDDADHAVEIANKIGYPVMIKASAGGGGKGMRIAWDDEEAKEGFARSKSEAAASFGDDRIFIEKFVTQPRHIEIQVLADAHGNCVYLGERECSIQRRNQKVIEEAPSPFLDEKTRKLMGEQSVALSKAVGYTSAGTVEFIVDGDRNFYFLEMNTRLQVEHPVTELITGVDLVEQMIRVAAGKKLEIKQTDIELNGWAVESRLYAEDPYRNFLPSIGRLTRYRPPEEKTQEDGTIVRNDTGVFEGGEISMFYDPMIAKLCTWGETRDKAMDAMSLALDQFEVEGIGHNLPFLSAVIDHSRFRKGALTTSFIADEYPDGFAGAALDKATIKRLAALAAWLAFKVEHRACQITGARPELNSLNDGSKFERVIDIEGKTFDAIITSIDSVPELELDGKDVIIQCDWVPGDTLANAVIGKHKFYVKIEQTAQGFRMRHGGADLDVRALSPRLFELSKLMPIKEAPDTSNLLLCPMPGMIVALHVSEAEHVEEGQALAVVEAMKMENVLRAERSGTVSKISAAVGDSLAVDEVIMEFET